MKVDLVNFLQCKLALQCRCQVSFKYFISLSVVYKGVYFVVAICLVHNNSHLSLVCGQYDYDLSFLLCRASERKTVKGLNPGVIS